MRNLALLSLLALASAALADVLFKNVGTRLGPVTTIDCPADAGIVCVRTASTGTGKLACASASTTETGCITASTQSLGGLKSFYGLADAGVALQTTTEGAKSGGFIISEKGFASGDAGVGTALAEFPACSANIAGRLLFDSTKRTWRYCDDVVSAWRTVGPHTLEDDQTTYFPGLSSLLNLPMTRAIIPRMAFNQSGFTAATFTVRIANAVTLVPGTGAGNAVFTIYDDYTPGATTATVTVPCAAVAGTITTGSTDTFTNYIGPQPFELRLTTDGCTTLPTLNIQWGYGVIAPTAL